MKAEFLHPGRLVSLLAVVLLWTTAALAAGPQEKVIYRFGSGSDGAYPSSTPTFDSSGNLYVALPSGGSGQCGTIIEVSPPGIGADLWTSTVIHDFNGQNDEAAGPYGRVVLDSAGNLYGTTLSGGTDDYGTVFELSPPTEPGGTWTYTLLYSFKNGSDGKRPYAGVVFDSSGNMYGTTNDGGGTCDQFYTPCGTVFELTPKAAGSGWNETVLYTFQGGNDGFSPVGGVVLDTAGNLYGTTLDGGKYGGGIAFELKRPSAPVLPWTEKILHSFGNGSDGANLYGSLVFDSAGNLYGTTYAGGRTYCGTPTYELECGVVFQLQPVFGVNGSVTWTENVIYDFPVPGDMGWGPTAELTIDSSGNLYSTTPTGGTGSVCSNYNYGCGTVFELSPSVGGGSWTNTVLHVFEANPDGSAPWGGLVFDSSGNLYGTTEYGGSSSGVGTVFKIIP